MTNMGPVTDHLEPIHQGGTHIRFCILLLFEGGRSECGESSTSSIVMVRSFTGFIGASHLHLPGGGGGYFLKLMNFDGFLRTLWV